MYVCALRYYVNLFSHRRRNLISDKTKTNPQYRWVHIYEYVLLTKLLQPNYYTQLQQSSKSKYACVLLIRETKHNYYAPLYNNIHVYTYANIITFYDDCTELKTTFIVQILIIVFSIYAVQPQYAVLDISVRYLMKNVCFVNGQRYYG